VRAEEGWIGEAGKRAEREKMISAVADGSRNRATVNLPRMGILGTTEDV
jgi:hypothetical protein